MPELFPFFLILFAGLIFSEIFNRLHLPYVTALILGGMLLGPFGFGLVDLDTTVEFLASIGVVFLMFIAGSEIKTKTLEEVGWQFSGLALANGLIPFAVGVSIGWWFGYELMTALVLGTIFVSSSVAVIIPALESSHLLTTRFGKVLLPAVVFEDLASLLLLSFLLQSVSERSALPPWLLLPIIIVLLVLLRVFLPRLRKVLVHEKKGSDLFETDLRFVFAVLLAAVVLFELLGLHAIIAGFLIGMILGDTMQGRVRHKVHTVSYGLFIPVFFISVGMRMDLSAFASSGALMMMAVVVLGSMGAKFASGMLGAAMARLKGRELVLTGVATMPSLSTTLAAAFTASQYGLVTDDLVAALIVLTIVTSFIVPILIRRLSKGWSQA